MLCALLPTWRLTVQIFFDIIKDYKYKVDGFNK